MYSLALEPETGGNMEQGAWDALRKINEDFACQRPNVGTTVRVVEGKQLGVVGKVTWHGRDKYNNPYRYCDSMQAHLVDVLGKYGFRVRIETDEGEKFFISADKVWVL